MEMLKTYTIIIEGERISTAGMMAVNHYLNAQDLPRLSTIGWSWRWIDDDGLYRGKFPKRVGAYITRGYGIPVDSKQISEIGNIARAHILSGMTYIFDFTDKFDWNAGDFGDAGSCFWGCRNLAREVMEGEGVLAIRFHDALGYTGIGRALLYEMSNEQWVLFNAYGMTTENIADVFTRYLAEDTSKQWEYAEIDLTVCGEEEGLVYINSKPQVIYEKDTECPEEIDLKWTEYGECIDCGNWYLVSEMELDLDGYYVCDNC